VSGDAKRSDVTVTVTLGELEQLRNRLGCFASMSNPDLSRWMVDVTDDGVRWTATDSYRLGRLTAGTADGVRAFGVPVRTFTLAWQMCDRRNAADVAFAVDGEDRGALRVDGVEVPFDASLDGYPDIDVYLTRRGKAAGTAVTLAAEDLFAAIHGANLRPPWLDADQQQSFVLHVDATAGRLRAVATWDGHADTSATVACTASGDTRVGVNPGFLFDLASAAGEDVLTLHLPPDPSVPLRVETDDGFLALLMPVRIGVESARPAFEAMLAELLDVDPADLERDGDGDYPVPLSDDHLLYLSLIEGDDGAGTPDTVCAFAILAHGVDPTPELLTELNDLNRHVRFARLYWADGAVLVGDELLLSTLDAAELGHACRIVAALAARVAPLLEAVHGGAA
jgi:type III secretion system-like peptide-binding chaperone